jgi:hypothetical protein
VISVTLTLLYLSEGNSGRVAPVNSWRKSHDLSIPILKAALDTRPSILASCGSY